MHTFFIWAGLMFRSFFIGLARKLARTALSMMVEMFCAGSTPAAVKLIQLITGAETDGDWGPNTDDAVRAWQQKYKLEEDGLFDKADWQIVMDWLATT